MSKFLIVSLLQVVIAQYIPGGKHYVRTNTNNDHQFYFRYPDSRNLEHSQVPEFRTEDINSYVPYLGQNEHNYYRSESPRHQPIINGRTGIKTDDYIITNGPEKDQYNTAGDNHEERHVSGEANNSDRRYHRIHINRQKGRYRPSQEPDTVNTDLNSQSNSYGAHSDFTGTDYRAKDVNHVQVRTNQNSTDNPGVLRPTNKYIELTTVPVVLLMSVTLKTNPNIHSRYADSEMANDNPAEVRHNSDSIIFSEIDNRHHGTLDKTTTDNEIRLNKYDTNDEHWIWSDGTDANTSTTTVKALPDGGLDDRTALIASECAAGQAKVKGICTPTS